MSETALLLKHYRLLTKNIDSLSDGQARLKPADEDSDQGDSLATILISLAPRSGPYRGGQFDFELDLSEGYPTSPPVVRSRTPIYHPNVDCCCDYSEGDVCLNLLDELWTTDMTLEDVVQGLLFLLHEPNLEDPLNSMFDGSEDEEEFHQNVRKSLRGGMEINGVLFERNLVDGYDSEVEEENEDAPRKSGEDAPSNQGINCGIEEALTTETESELTVAIQNDCPATELDDTPPATTTIDSVVPLQAPPFPHPSDSEVGTPPVLRSTESSVDREQSSTLFSQRELSFDGFDKMWTLSLNSVIRTIVLGAQMTLQRLDSSSVDVR